MGQVEESRVAASRRRVRQRLSQVGQAAEREKQRALVVKDAALALLGALGALLAVRRVGKAISGRKRKKKGGKRGGAPPSSTR